MTGILKVDQWKDSGDNALMTSDGAGVLTANTDLNLGGSIIKNGNLIADVSGNIRLDADDAGEVRLLDGGTQYAALKNDSSRLKIQGIIQDQDILIVGNDGGVETTAVAIDMSEGGRSRFYGGVSLGGDGAVNTMDDYEEGTWTPSLNGTSGGDVDGRYVKVGRLVTCYMQAWAFTSTAVSATISGFPFSSPSGQVYISGTVGANTWTNNGASVWGYSASGVFVYDCVNQQEATAIAGSPKYFSFSITYYTA